MWHSKRRLSRILMKKILTSPKANQRVCRTIIKQKIESWIILSDMQVPYQDVQTMIAVEKYMAAHRWDGLLNIGDFMDMNTISNFNKGKPRQTQGQYISADFEEGNKILDRHQAIIRKRNKHAQFVYLEGNHEERVERWLDENPMFDGYFNIPKALNLDKRGFKWVRAWTNNEIYSIGKANFVHGKYTNQYHPAKMAHYYGDNIFYGHTHDMMCHAVAKQLHPDKVHVGQSIGCLCLPQKYMKGNFNNWQQGFMVLFVLPNGNFTYYLPRIFNHKFIGPDGVLYEP